MATFRFPGYPAVDPATNQVVTNAVGQVYAVTDTSFTTPLTVTDLTGTPMTLVKVGPLGVTEQFITTDQPEVNWKSGSYVIYLWSPMSMVAATSSSASAAASSAAAAEASRLAAEAATALSTGQARFTVNTASGWAASAVILANGQPGYATDTNEIRVGNGVSTWSGLPVISGGAGSVTVDTLLGAGATGRAVMKAVDPGTARTAIGAGTSNLTLGTGALQAKAGNWQPTVTEVTGLEIELTTRELLIRWNPSSRTWPTRPVTYPFGALFLSTNDATASAPNDAGLQIGDVWRRHPNAA